MRFYANRAPKGKGVKRQPKRPPIPEEDKTPEGRRRRKNARSKKWRDNNLEQNRKAARDRKATTREKDWERAKERLRTDPVFNLTCKIRKRINMALKSGRNGTLTKTNKSMALLGCNFEEFKVYIEGKLKDGMTWDDIFNGRVHLDHIRPLAMFDLSDPMQQLVAFNYRNIQPLWAQDNWIKNCRWSDEDLDWSTSFAPHYVPDAQEAVRFYAEGDSLLTADVWSPQDRGTDI